MNTRTFLAVLFASLFLSSAAKAQIGVYGKLNMTHFDDKVDRTSNWFYGPGAGIYYDFLPLGPIAVGADVRGSYGYASQLNFRSVLGGLRLVARPPLLPIRPYIEGVAGIAGTRATSGASGYPMSFSNKLAWEILGGVDFTILPHIDIRLPEVGYGQVTPVNGYTSAPYSTLLEISTGVVVRLP